MPLHFKITDCGTSYDYLHDYTGKLFLHNLQSILISWDIDASIFDDISFCVNENKMSDDSMYDVSESEIVDISIYCSDFDNKKFLVDKIIELGLDKIIEDISSDESSDLDEFNNLSFSSIPTESMESIPTESIPTESIIATINQETISTIQDEDFKHLIRIFRTRPELFNKFSMYIQHGDFVVINNSNENTYEESVQHIKQLNIGVDDDTILTYLRRYSGHLNLTIRALLTI